MPEVIKICNGCKAEKPFSAFSVVKPGRGDRNNLASRCKQCRSERNTKWHHENFARARENRRRHYENNRQKESMSHKAWKERNKDQYLAGFSAWLMLNKSRRALKQREREAAKLQAMPSWLTAIDRAQTEEHYEIAQAVTIQTGVKHHVDHVFPLQGNGYSGLHVAWNLQVIPAIKNISKKNNIPFEHSDLFWSTR